MDQIGISFTIFIFSFLTIVCVFAVVSYIRSRKDSQINLSSEVVQEHVVDPQPEPKDDRPQLLTQPWSESDIEAMRAHFLKMSQEWTPDYMRARMTKEADQKKFVAEMLLQSKDCDQFSDEENAELNRINEKISEIEKALAQNVYIKTSKRSGYVYVLSNPIFRNGVVKIGMTRSINPMERVNSLYTTSLPIGFEVELIHYSNDALDIEQKLHLMFSAERINSRREFFYATPEQVRSKLLDLDGIIVYFNPEADQSQSIQRSGRRSATVVKTL